MIAVIFESEPHPDRQQAYLEAAFDLRVELQQAEGFVSIEKFESLAVPGKLLALSFWRDEEAVRRWRNLEARRRTQGAARRSIFADYRLRVATVTLDYTMRDRTQAPPYSNAALGD